jgi:glycine oxidase
MALDVGDVERAGEWAVQNRVHIEVLDAAAIDKLTPGLAGVSGAVWMPDIAQVRNPRFLKAMQVYLVEQGASLLPDSEVSAVETSAGAVTGVRIADGRFFPADRVVIANGAWSGKLLRQMNIELQVHPVRGQMVLLAPQSRLPGHIVLKNGHYLIPRRDGRIVVGKHAAAEYGAWLPPRPLGHQ